MALMRRSSRVSASSGELVAGDGSEADVGQRQVHGIADKITHSP